MSRWYAPGVSSEQEYQRIPPLDRTPHVAWQVAEHLARSIATGALAPGEKLPGETVLAERLGVSRPTLREALRMLRQRGLVSIRPRSGTYVSKGAAKPGGEPLAGLVDGGHLWEVLELRRTLEPELAALAARRGTPADLARLRELMRAAGEVEAADLVRWKDGAHVYGRFFFLLARATHNALFCRLAEDVAGMQREALAYSRLRLASRPETGTALRRQFRAILEALEQRDEAAARAATAEHLEFIERTLREIEAEEVPG